MGPFVDGGLDEAFGLAVGTRRVGPGAAMFLAEWPPQPGELLAL